MNNSHVFFGRIDIPRKEVEEGKERQRERERGASERSEKSQLNGQATFTIAEVPLFRSGAPSWNDIPAIFSPLPLLPSFLFTLITTSFSANLPISLDFLSFFLFFYASDSETIDLSCRKEKKNIRRTETILSNTIPKKSIVLFSRKEEMRNRNSPRGARAGDDDEI